MTQMADNALNQDHSRTTSMPNHMAELGSGNFDRELTLSLLGTERNALDQIETAINGSKMGVMAGARPAARIFPTLGLEAIPYAAHCVQCASDQENVLTTVDFRRGLQRRVLPR